MLDSFWNSLELEDISDLNYTTYVEYLSIEQKEEVLEKLDWVILKLHKIKDKCKYDYDIVTALKNKIKYNNCSLTIKGVEYLNLITSDLKKDTF
jgi:hypothetical protein